MEEQGPECARRIGIAGQRPCCSSQRRPRAPWPPPRILHTTATTVTDSSERMCGAVFLLGTRRRIEHRWATFEHKPRDTQGARSPNKFIDPDASSPAVSAKKAKRDKKNKKRRVEDGLELNSEGYPRLSNHWHKTLSADLCIATVMVTNPQNAAHVTSLSQHTAGHSCFAGKSEITGMHSGTDEQTSKPVAGATECIF